MCHCHEACKLLNEYDLPVNCEEIWASDVKYIQMQPVVLLRETGFINRVLLWDDSIKARYREVAEAI